MSQVQVAWVCTTSQFSDSLASCRGNPGSGAGFFFLVRAEPRWFIRRPDISPKRQISVGRTRFFPKSGHFWGADIWSGLPRPDYLAQWAPDIWPSSQPATRYLPVAGTRYLVEDPGTDIWPVLGRVSVTAAADIWPARHQISVAGPGGQISGRQLSKISAQPAPWSTSQGTAYLKGSHTGVLTQIIWSRTTRYLVTAMYSRLGGGLPVAQLGLRFSTVPVQQPLHQACSGPSLHMGLRPRASVSYCHWCTWASPHPLQRFFLWKLPVHN